MGQQRTYLKWDQFGFPLASRDRFETLQCLRDWAVAKCAVCFAYGCYNRRMKTYINVRVPTKAYKKLRKRADREGRTLVGLIELLA